VHCLPSGIEGLAILMRSAAFLLPWLRPSTPSEFMAAPTASRGWAVCLATLSSLLCSLSTPDEGQEQGMACASVLRVLLDEVLPVLTHAASHACWASSGYSGDTAPRVSMLLLQQSTAQPGADLNAGPPVVPAVSGSGLTVRVPPAVPHTLPVESTLLLLGASASLLRFCVAMAVDSTLSRSLHPATHATPQDDLVAALDAVLALASDLVSGGPRWQQAKAHHPLALVNALYNTSLVSGQPAQMWRAKARHLGIRPAWLTASPIHSA
jgi:hypothetical protein